MPKIGKSIETESRLVVARGWRKGGWGVIANGYRVSFGGDGNIIKLIVVMVAQLWEYTKKHWITHFEWVNCMVCEVHLNIIAAKIKSPRWHCNRKVNARGYFDGQVSISQIYSHRRKLTLGQLFLKWWLLQTITAWFVKAKSGNNLNAHQYRVWLNELNGIFKMRKLLTYWCGKVYKTDKPLARKARSVMRDRMLPIV